MSSRRLLLLSLFFLAACHRISDHIEPKLHAQIQTKYIATLPSAIFPLSSAEEETNWGKEMTIGLHFAKECDFYQAITAFKRAEILLPKEKLARRLDLQYAIMLCYFLSGKWQDVLYTYDHSDLKHVGTSFLPYHDVLLMRYEAYKHLHEEREAARVEKEFDNHYPGEETKLRIANAVYSGHIEEIDTLAQKTPEYPQLHTLVTEYTAHKKSPGKAQLLNAVVPGAGYFYLGQYQSGVTAVLLNGLFIGASVYFFDKGNVAAGAIFASFEAGWYFGGIYGAGLEAKAYNERLFEKLASPYMTREKLFPVLMLRYKF